MSLQFFLFGKLKGMEVEGNSMGMCYEKPTPELDPGWRRETGSAQRLEPPPHSWCLLLIDIQLFSHQIPSRNQGVTHQGSWLSPSNRN